MGEIAGAVLRRQAAREPADLRLGGGQRRRDRVKPRDHPFDVAVDRRRRQIERDRRDGGGGVIADAGQRAQLRNACREFAAVTLDHGAGAGVQVSGASVIAEPGPGFQHVIERRRSQRADIVPALQETGVIGRDGLDRGLLQHDFGEPDPVRIGALAGRRAPRQLAAMAVVPGQQGGGLRA